MVIKGANASILFVLTARPELVRDGDQHVVGGINPSLGAWGYPDQPPVRTYAYDAVPETGSASITSNGNERWVWDGITRRIKADTDWLYQWIGNPGGGR